MSELHHTVFVYGTLRQGEENHHLLGDSRCLWEQAWVQGSLFDTGLGYPAALLEGSGRILGEVYEVTADTLTALDELEEYTPGGGENLYERVEVAVETDHAPCTALVYVYSQPNATRLSTAIPGGDWCLYRQTHAD